MSCVTQPAPAVPALQSNVTSLLDKDKPLRLLALVTPHSDTHLSGGYQLVTEKYLEQNFM